MAIALAAYPALRVDRLRPLVALEGLVAVLPLAAGLVLRSAGPLPWALFFLGVEYATSLLLGGRTVDAFAPIVGAGFLCLAEVAGWAAEAGIVPDERDLAIRRIVTTSLATVVAGGTGALLLASSEFAFTGGVLLETLGVLAAVVSLGLVGTLAWRRAEPPDPFA